MAEAKNYMSREERETAQETIDYHDLTPTEQALAMQKVNERAATAPFNRVLAYHTAHAVCAEIVRNRTNYNMTFIEDCLARGDKWRIVPKRDFGTRGGSYFKGEWIRHGFIITLGGCSVMPGAVWFFTVADAMTALRKYIDVRFNTDEFWKVYYKKGE